MNREKRDGVFAYVEIAAGSIDEAKQIIKARDKFWRAYARDKGWPVDPGQLTVDQILEIRKQPGWKRPDVSAHS